MSNMKRVFAARGPFNRNLQLLKDGCGCPFYDCLTPKINTNFSSLGNVALPATRSGWSTFANGLNKRSSDSTILEGVLSGTRYFYKGAARSDISRPVASATGSQRV